MMTRFLTSLLVMLLSAWPARPAASGTMPRARRGRRLPTRAGVDDAQDAIEAPERARARTPHAHQWTGEVRVWAGERCDVVRGRWRFTVDAAQRAQIEGQAGPLSLDPTFPEVWETQLESLLTLRIPGARLAVARADRKGWRELELRAPTLPETVVQVDRAAVARILDADASSVRVELRVQA